LASKAFIYSLTRWLVFRDPSLYQRHVISATDSSTSMGPSPNTSQAAFPAARVGSLYMQHYYPFLPPHSPATLISDTHYTVKATTTVTQWIKRELHHKPIYKPQHRCTSERSPGQWSGAMDRVDDDLFGACLIPSNLMRMSITERTAWHCLPASGHRANRVGHWTVYVPVRGTNKIREKTGTVLYRRESSKLPSLLDSKQPDEHKRP